MIRIFVSYKSEDGERVVRLAQALQSCGLDIWWDRYLPGSQNRQAKVSANVPVVFDSGTSNRRS